MPSCEAGSILIEFETRAAVGGYCRQRTGGDDREHIAVPSKELANIS